MQPTPLAKFFERPAPWKDMGILTLDYVGESPTEVELVLGNQDDPDGDFPGVTPLGLPSFHYLVIPHVSIPKGAQGWGVFLFAGTQWGE